VSKLQLTLACLPYDRVAPLLTGEVGVEGVDLTPITIRWPVEVFSRMLRGEFDIAEMSITHCFVLRQLKRARFVTLPIFPSRAFRHGFTTINAHAGIREPKDLEGKRIGVQGHQNTAAIWIRGILQEDYGVSFDNVRWFEGGVNQPGVAGGSATVLRPSAPLNVQHIGERRTLSDMLAAGEIDALINPELPDSLFTSKDVVRLFPDFHRRERDYYKRTGIFPIMHGLVMREELYQRHPWLATSIFKAFQRAKTLAQEQARFTGAMAYMLPWMSEQIDEIDEVFGRADWWPYGLEPNRKTLEAYSRFLVRQTFMPEAARLEETFVSVQEAAAHG
jgi:4,5-dihydroxyphthalate decarboxylase